MTWTERQRWALYRAIVAALETGHPRRIEVARALEALIPGLRRGRRLETDREATP